MGVFVTARVLVGGGGVFVRAGTEVFVGTRMAVFVGTGVIKTMKPGKSKRSRGVGLTTEVDVLGGLGVTDRVIVGVAEINGVAVAVAEGVRLGKVDVGNGPSRASTVPARAVLVSSMFVCSSIPCALESLKRRL
jgi:hypothetical protein